MELVFCSVFMIEQPTIIKWTGQSNFLNQASYRVHCLHTLFLQGGPHQMDITYLEFEEFVSS